MEKSKYFTSLDYRHRREAKATLAEHLATQEGWKVFGYREDTSDSMTDYFNPASWGGIATFGDFVLVVDERNTSDSGKAIKKETQEFEPCEHCLESGEEPNGWTLGDARKDPKAYHKYHDTKINNGTVSGLTSVVSPLGFTEPHGDTSVEKCYKCRGKGQVYSHTTSVITGYWPTFQANPKAKGWHLEKDGKIITSGQSIAKLYRGYWEGHHPEQKEQVVLECRSFQNELHRVMLLTDRQPFASELNDSKPELSPVHSIDGAFEIIDYSEKAIALKGDTKPHKEKLGRSGIGGTFNAHLKHPSTGEKFVGWIFSKKKRAEVEAFLQSL